LNASSTLDARDSLVTGSATTGVSLLGGWAKLQRCVVRNGIFSIALDEGA